MASRIVGFTLVVSRAASRIVTHRCFDLFLELLGVSHMFFIQLLYLLNPEAQHCFILGIGRVVLDSEVFIHIGLKVVAQPGLREMSLVTNKEQVLCLHIDDPFKEGASTLLRQEHLES